MSEIPSRSRAALWVAFLSAAVGAPALWIPFLSDDWIHLEWARNGVLGRTPIGYFRPLTMFTYRLEWELWGPKPALFHLTNVLLVAGCALLAVLVIRGFTGDGRLAAWAGVLFALHPYHIETVAWVAGRTDPLYSLFVLGAVLRYQKWRRDPRVWPFDVWLLFTAALLAKETAVVLPLALMAIDWLQKRPQAAREWGLGFLPVLLITLVHFLVIRPAALGGGGFFPFENFGIHWLFNFLRFGIAGLLPLNTELLESHQLYWGAAALAVAGVLFAATRRSSHTLRLQLAGALIVFALLVGPAIMSFQERFFFLPSAVSSFALACVLLRAAPKVRVLLTTLLLGLWVGSAGFQWQGWFEAGAASSSLVAGLVHASKQAGTEEIVVAGMPHRVHGAAVAANFEAALRVAGGEDVSIREAAAIDYPGTDSSALAALPVVTERSAAVVLAPPAVLFSRFVRPIPQRENALVIRPWAAVAFDGRSRARVEMPFAPGRAVFVWNRGSLLPLEP